MEVQTALKSLMFSDYDIHHFNSDYKALHSEHGVIRG